MSLSASNLLLLFMSLLHLLIGYLGASSSVVSVSSFDGKDETLLSCDDKSSLWKFEGSMIEDVAELNVEQKTSSLIIYNINHNLEGIYECLGSSEEVITTFDVTVIALPSFTGCDPTSSSCFLSPINTFTGSNITFNASISYTNASTKPFIGEVYIQDGEDNVLAICEANNPCSFQNAFEGRTIKIEANDNGPFDTWLFVVQNASLSDTGSYRIHMDFSKFQSSSKVQTYTGNVNVNVTLHKEEPTSPTPSPSPSITPSSQVTLTPSPISIAPSQTNSVLTMQATISSIGSILTTETSMSPPPEKENGDWMILAGAVVGTFVFTIIICLIIVASILVSQQKKSGKKSSDCESDSSTSPTSSTMLTDVDSSDQIQESCPSNQTEQGSEEPSSKQQTTGPCPIRQVSISISIPSPAFTDYTPPEPTGSIPHLSNEKNSVIHHI